jgi:hypothetical protein
MLQQLQHAISGVLGRPHPQQKLLDAMGGFLDSQPEGAARTFLSILLAMEMQQNIREGDGILNFLDRASTARKDGQIPFLPSEQEIIWRYVAGMFAEATQQRMNANGDEPFVKRKVDDAMDAINEHPGVAAKAIGWSVIFGIIPILGSAAVSTLVATTEARRVLAEGTRKFAGDMWQSTDEAYRDIGTMSKALNQFIESYKAVNNPDVVSAAVPEQQVQQQVHLQQRT